MSAIRQPAAHALCVLFFFFNDTATTEIYTLSLHDALPICEGWHHNHHAFPTSARHGLGRLQVDPSWWIRSEEHTSELQSLAYLVCRLLLEKKKHIQKWVRFTCSSSVFDSITSLRHTLQLRL